MAATPKPFSWHKEISGVALAISLPQIISAPLSVGLAKLMYSQNIAYELKEILDFLLISFPLTFAMAMIASLIKSGEFNIIAMVIVLAIALLLSNLLHKIFGETPSIDVNQTFDYSENERAGSNMIFKWVFRVLGVYWDKFGPILFIQSVAIGIYVGLKYTRKKSPRVQSQK
jgi:hypothetical protein